MCCFSGPVESVNSTKIFARFDGDRQYLVYSMSLSAKKDVAMVLPIPISLSGDDERVSFVNMETYPEFFDDLRSGFPVTRSSGAATRGLDKLKVHDVGAFEASFVPDKSRFKDLDPKFRMPESAWDNFPEYKSYGFVVFKLKAGDSKLHPMAFSFSRHPKLVEAKGLFFPTVHIHDGKVYAFEKFDHTLYYQCDKASGNGIDGDDGTHVPASVFTNKEKCPPGVLNRDQRVFRRSLIGMRENKDTVILT